MLAAKILNFYKKLTLQVPLPDDVEYMNPYRDKKTFGACTQFYEKFYNDSGKRKIILGINPGRFGAGTTGVPFTDPIKLEKICGIDNGFPKKVELSADFIYLMIDALGGPEKFYKTYFISSMSPLGFTRNGKNLNYYDIKELQEAVEPFMIDCIQTQLAFGIDRRTAYCLGEGENFKYLSKLNRKLDLFEEIVPLPHPRFIMQYRRKKLDEYVSLYLSKLT